MCTRKQSGVHECPDHTLCLFDMQLLLRIGITRSKRAPTAQHPYGYMKDKFVWSLVSAVGIFCLGAGVTAANAFSHFMHPPEQLEHLALGFAGVRLCTRSVGACALGGRERESERHSLPHPSLPHTPRHTHRKR